MRSLDVAGGFGMKDFYVVIVSVVDIFVYVEIVDFDY